MSSLRHVHMAGNNGYTVWDIHGEFLTFIKSLPQLAYLGLEGSCIPGKVLTDTPSTSQMRFEHPNLCHLWLRGAKQKVFRCLEFIPLQTLDNPESHAKRMKDISEIPCQNPQRIFRDFLEGRNGAARSLTFFSSGSVLEITIKNSDCRTEHGVNTPPLKFTVTGFNETALKAWKTLVRTLSPLADVEAVVLHNVQSHSSDVEHLLQLVPRS